MCRATLTVRVSLAIFSVCLLALPQPAWAAKKSKLGGSGSNVFTLPPATVGHSYTYTFQFFDQNTGVACPPMTLLSGPQAPANLQLSNPNGMVILQGTPFPASPVPLTFTLTVQGPNPQDICGTPTTFT